MFQQRQESIDDECGGCLHINYCRGGCPYNVLAANGGSFTSSLRDPHRPAYKRIFEHITDRALEEVFSEDNLAAVVASIPGKHGLLHKGSLLRIMRGGFHPQEARQQARKTVAAVALAASDSPEEAVQALERAGLAIRSEAALQSLNSLQARLHDQAHGLANAYLHVTYGCNLSCEHCYASAGPQHTGESMHVKQVESLVREVAQAGFHKVVITGGEPLAHPQRGALLEALAALRPAVKPMQIVLRTNLASRLSADLLEKLFASADQIVVSLDGDQATHDARRGAGTYARTLANLRELVRFKPLTADYPGCHAQRTANERRAGEKQSACWQRSWALGCASSRSCRLAGQPESHMLPSSTPPWTMTAMAGFPGHA